ncbi:uncharacterized protein Tco_1190261, partial [Tanacetum coccineum]
ITTAATAAGHRPPAIAAGTTADHLLWSVCKLLGKEVYTSLNTDVKQKVTWYVLNNSPEIDTDIVAYKNAFSSNNVEKEFPRWINDEMRQKRVNKDPSCTSELFSLACGPSSNATLYIACLVNGVGFMELTYIGCNKVVLFGCKWFDINNEPTQPTQTTVPEPTQTADPQQTKTVGPDRVNEFEKLFGRATDKLFPDCDWMTSLDFMAKMSHAKVLGKTTDSGFNLILEVLQQAFPPSKGFKLPLSYYEMKKTFKTIGLGYESIHACINDCCLFWGDTNKKLDNCLICGASRWKDKKTNGKKVANKVVRYFPLKPRLQRMYSSEHTAKDMTWHATGKSKDGKMYHPVDGKAWKIFDIIHPTFAKEPRNVRLGLAADGFNPFGMLSQNYSMWPVILTTYNTPPWVCMKETSLMLTMLIPGPKTVGKDIDVYLQPLIAELHTLWKDGVRTKDAATGTHFIMKVALLWTINDFPARSSLSGWTGQGYFACPTCNKDTPVIRVRGKQAYVGHRKWLRVSHQWRKKHHASKFNGKVEKGHAPNFTKAEIEEQLSRLPIRVPGKHPSNKQKKPNRKVELNWSKKSIFYKLEYWHTLDLKHNLDVMHIEKNVLESLLGTLLMNDHSKDTIKARQDLEDNKIRPELWLSDNGNGKFLKPHPKYSFKPQDRTKFCQYIKGVKLPDGFGSYWKHKVNDDNSNITNI